jgi:hypothetical protein
MSDAQAHSSHNANESPNGTLQLALQGAQRGAADATEAAVRTWAATSRFVQRIVYTSCYTLSYGVVFPSVLVARSVPRNNAAVQGLIEGAHAARRKVEGIYQPALESPTLAPA